MVVQEVRHNISDIITMVLKNFFSLNLHGKLSGWGNSVINPSSRDDIPKHTLFSFILQPVCFISSLNLLS